MITSKWTEKSSRSLLLRNPWVQKTTMCTFTTLCRQGEGARGCSARYDIHSLACYNESFVKVHKAIWPIMLVLRVLQLAQFPCFFSFYPEILNQFHFFFLSCFWICFSDRISRYKIIIFSSFTTANFLPAFSIYKKKRVIASFYFLWVPFWFS